MDGVVAFYPDDSFFTLSLAGQVGLALLSCLLAVGTVLLVWRVSRRGVPVLRLLMGLAVFWVFVWLSPQVYYGYYLLIFDGLPLQWVVQNPPSLVHVAELLGFAAQEDLSHHGQGVLGWLCIGTALWPERNAPVL